MRNVKSLKGSYVKFDNLQQLVEILDVYTRLGFNYANGSHQDAIDTARWTAVNKLTVKDGFVMTSKTKDNTISFSTFMSLAPTLTSNEILTNNSRENMNTPRQILNQLKAEKLFKDEKYLESLAKKAEGFIDLADTFEATLNKAHDKGMKLCELAAAYTVAIEEQNISEIERLEKLMDSVVKYVTKTNEVLKSISETGAAIIKANKKEEVLDGEKFIWE